MKSVIIFRHGPAEEATRGQPDADRQLTKEGAEAVETAAKGMRRILQPVHLIASSPYLRAVQTAEIVARVYNGPAFIRTDALAPGQRSKDLLGWLWQTPPNETVVLVGHEPDLGHLASLALAGTDWSFWHPDKAGACLLTLPDSADPGTGRLEWALKVDQLRGLAP